MNGQIGMLFIDFKSQRRMRINGRAKIVADQHVYDAVRPLAQRYLQVETEQVYGNCRVRIPRMKLITPTNSDFQDE